MANFGSSYLSLNYPKSRNISNSVSFILNELLENAVKLSSLKEDSIRITIKGDQVRVIVEVLNPINPDQYAVFRTILEEIKDTVRANTKYIERFNSSSGGRMGSGIGLLSIINFFQSHITAKFEKREDGTGFEARVRVMINIEDL